MYEILGAPVAINQSDIDGDLTALLLASLYSCSMHDHELAN